MLKKINENLSNHNSKINKLLPFFVILLFIILNLTLIINLYNNNVNKENLLRLHVVANSNSIEDQITKLKVYEKVNNYINNINKNIYDNSNVMSNIENNVQDILNISNKTIKDNNLNYQASLNLGKINYDEKKSILINMEEGTYNSVQIILGEGNGQNIWSLIAPNKENLENLENLNTILPGINSLNDCTLNSKDIKITYEFKILEIFNNLF